MLSNFLCDGKYHRSKTGRLLSIDVMRGLIMILLAAESCSVYESLKQLHPGGVFNSFLNQFFHHPWHGLHFWDLVQPSFMLIAGTAMYISYYSKKQKGISWEMNLRHIAIRSLKLFLLGTGLHCVYAGKLVWELWNVLTQLSFTTIIAYLIINRSVKFQIIVSVLLLVITEVLYRIILVPGFDKPFVEYHNFGAYLDTVLMGKINQGGWVAINIIPTAGHTIWGGSRETTDIRQTGKSKNQVPITRRRNRVDFGLWVGSNQYYAHYQTYRNKCLYTCIGRLGIPDDGFLYWLIDIKKFDKYAWIAVVVGMNAIFIYLFFETVGYQWLNGVVAIFVRGFLGLAGISPEITAVISAFTTLIIEWYICYWVSRNKIFVKL